MRIRIIASLAVVLIGWGCASMRDTVEGRESGTSRIVGASFDQTWVAVVAVLQPYPAAEMNRAGGKVVTGWIEQLVEPSTFGEQQLLKQRARWTVTVSARDDGSHVRVLHEVEYFAPVYTDSAAPSWGTDYFAPWRGKSPVADSSTTVSVPPNPWDQTRGAPVYVWRKASQIAGAPSQQTRDRENQLLDAVEAALRGASEQGGPTGTARTDATG